MQNKTGFSFGWWRGRSLKMNGDHCRSESHDEKLLKATNKQDFHTLTRHGHWAQIQTDKQTVKISACLLRLSCSLHTEVKSTCSRSSAWSIDGCLIRRWVTAGVAADKSLWLTVGWPSASSLLATLASWWLIVCGWFKKRPRQSDIFHFNATYARH